MFSQALRYSQPPNYSRNTLYTTFAPSPSSYSYSTFFLVRARKLEAIWTSRKICLDLFLPSSHPFVLPSIRTVTLTEIINNYVVAGRAYPRRNRSCTREYILEEKERDRQKKKQEKMLDKDPFRRIKNLNFCMSLIHLLFLLHHLLLLLLLYIMCIKNIKFD